ncbi:hypothetical protein J3R82DRAFT_4330 [Butyriboletus roseoflavus]|nr:hypothetical protein J3R82DRAFT_4330 [Butyriboletus roseoflavus]
MYNDSARLSPDPYLEGAARCGVRATDCLVVEDAPAGVVSGLTAGSRVIGLLTTHSREQMLEASGSAPDGYFYLAQNLSSVSMVLADNGLGVEIIVTLNQDM